MFSSRIKQSKGFSLLAGVIGLTVLSGSAMAMLPKCNSSLEISEPCSGNPAAQKKRKAVVNKLYTSLIFPTPIEILNKTPTGQAIVSSIFETDPSYQIKGRVTPAGTYNGLLGAEEYFWGLGATIFSSVTAVNVKSIIASDDKVAVEVDLNFCQAGNDCTQYSLPYGRILDENKQLIAYTLTQTGFYQFNKKNRVIRYDLSLLNLGAAVEAQPAEVICTYLIAPPTDEQGNPNPYYIPTGGNCTNFWNRPNQYPASWQSNFDNPANHGWQNAMANCIKFMHSLPQGTYYRANSNTQTCRGLHMLLTPYRVEHCGHSGPKGLNVTPILDGNGQPVLDEDGYPTYTEGTPKCADFSYESYYNEGF